MNIQQNIFSNISVGIVTRYDLDGPGTESRWEATFSAPVQSGPGAHPTSYIMGTGLFLEVQRPRRGVYHPPKLASRLKLWAFVACSRVTFSFIYNKKCASVQLVYLTSLRHFEIKL
jgi:hypothetical protein